MWSHTNAKIPHLRVYEPKIVVVGSAVVAEKVWLLLPIDSTLGWLQALQSILHLQFSVELYLCFVELEMRMIIKRKYNLHRFRETMYDYEIQYDKET